MTDTAQLQSESEIERIPIGLPTLAAKEASERLDSLTASLSTQYHRYLKHHDLSRDSVLEAESEEILPR